MGTKVAVALVIVALLGYGVLKALPLLMGPRLTITSPVDNATIPGGMVTISGEATRAVTLTLNGAPLLATEDGFFSTTLAYPHGSSILTFVAKDRFGQTITKTRTIYIP